MPRPSMSDPEQRQALLRRLRSLRADTPARWGRMDAPRMVAHLTDQMSHTLGDVPVASKPGFLRWPPVRWAFIYWLPFPKGRAKGPPEAFVTQPEDWSQDLERLIALVERFGAEDPESEWHDHALFGPMSGKDWGVFCHKHFDHHLRQFGC